MFDQIDGSILVSGNIVYTALVLSERIDLMSGLNIDTTVPLTDGTVVDVPHSFAIKATAKGGFSHWKAIDSKIIVCGFEAISRVDEIDFTKTLDIGPSAAVFSVDAAAIFSSNDTFCPPIAYHLRLDDTTFAASTLPTADDNLNFYLEGSSLKLFAQTEKVHSFFIYAVSVTNKLAKKPAILTV